MRNEEDAAGVGRRVRSHAPRWRTARQEDKGGNGEETVAGRGRERAPRGAGTRARRGGRGARFARRAAHGKAFHEAGSAR